jgi:Rrf2 family protein
LQPSEKTITLAEIAARQTISVAYLEQLFAKMKRADLVHSTRGTGGGYKLSREANEISISQIIFAVDEKLDPRKCEGKGNCQGGKQCLSHRLWDDLLSMGFIPFDLHFCHTFHNPVNAPFGWATRSCRDLKPSLSTLQMMIERCVAVIAVASGPFVLAASIMPSRTIYLQKHHHVSCYMRDFPMVLDLLAYAGEFGGDRQTQEQQHLVSMLKAIEVNN